MRRKPVKIVLAVLLALAGLVVVLNWTWGRLPDQPAMTGKLVSVDGVKVRVLERPGREPAVVLVHGLPGTANDWDAVTKLLPGRRTIAFDRPGFGYSDGGYFAFDRQLEILANLLHQVGTYRPILVGHSYGGTVALGFAAKHPEAVRGLVLVDAAAAGERLSGTERAQSHFVKFLSLPVVQPLADLTFSGAVRKASAKAGDTEAFDPDPVDPAHERQLLAMNMRHEDLDALAGEQLAANDVMEELDAQLAGIDVPAVVVHGKDDKLIEAKRGRRLAATLPDARLEMIPGGHMAPYVHPDVVAAAIRELASPRAQRLAR